MRKKFDEEEEGVSVVTKGSPRRGPEGARDADAEPPGPKVLTAYGPSMAHLTIVVRDLEETVRFYTGVLGFEVKRWRGRGRGKSAHLMAGPLNVVLVEGTTPGVHHLALRVNDLAGLAADLERAGTAFASPVAYRSRGAEETGRASEIGAGSASRAHGEEVSFDSQGRAHSLRVIAGA